MAKKAAKKESTKETKKSAAKPAVKKEAPAKEAKTKKAKEIKAVSDDEKSAVDTAKPKKAEKPTKQSAAAARAAAALTEETKKWFDLKEKHGAEKAANYSMSGVYESNKPIQHKILGWGYILSVQNDRLEVIFEQGTKMLISNYKG